jgi:hypothetical protein
MPVGVGIAVCPCQSLNAIPGQYQLVINKRKGFIKLAMRAGARLVPVIRCVLPDPSRLTEEWFWMMLRTVAMSVVARCGGVECPVTDGDVLVLFVSCVWHGGSFAWAPHTWLVRQSPVSRQLWGGEHSPRGPTL